MAERSDVAPHGRTKPPPADKEITSAGGDPKQVAYLTMRRRLVAARSLAVLKDGSGAQLALDQLKNPDPSLRSLAALALGEMLTPEQCPGLEPLLNDPDDGVRRAAAAAMIKVIARANG